MACSYDMSRQKKSNQGEQSAIERRYTITGFECRGAPARVRAWRCEGRPPLPHHFVCVEKSTLSYLITGSWGLVATLCTYNAPRARSSRSLHTYDIRTTSIADASRTHHSMLVDAVVSSARHASAAGAEC